MITQKYRLEINQLSWLYCEMRQCIHIHVLTTIKYCALKTRIMAPLQMHVFCDKQVNCSNSGGLRKWNIKCLGWWWGGEGKSFKKSVRKNQKSSKYSKHLKNIIVNNTGSRSWQKYLQC